ncbi:C6 transcription factor [Phlyctema vagabunda]|uniref:C6 transcription factor n=1 Tax=Phlyctema vagabunda TaxID=108571 RepID=A0ABR4PT52_9HELO
MSFQDGSGGYHPPPRDPRDPRDLREAESQYPPPPGEEDDRARLYHQRMPSSSSAVTLPSISQYDTQYAPPPPNGYAPDPRYQPSPYGAPPPPPPGQYRDDRAYQADYGRGAPQHMNFSQSAPRQRTAIACRYCRRRKIRCSGFDQNPEGRCSNCQRFQQECIFTPVSSAAQAFVPAHAVYPNMRNMGVGPDGRPRPMGSYPQGTQLFGAHGQPLGPLPPQPQPQSPYNDYPMASPTGSYSSFTDDRGQSASEPSRKRPLQDPHQTILPPPMPPNPPAYARSESSTRRPAADDEYRLPPVSPGPNTARAGSNYSPSSEHSSTSLQPPQQQSGLPSMSRTPPPNSRSSPGDRQDPMALGNIMEKRPEMDIDRNMLGRLDRSKDRKGQ